MTKDCECLKWETNRFGIETLELGHGLRLVVGYERIERLPTGAVAYNVWVFNRRLKERSPDGNSAKRRAELAARKWLTEALNIVSGETEQIRAQKTS